MEYSKKWADYLLLHSGDGEKVEKWGKYILKRPDPQAIWPMKNQEKVDAVYLRSREGGGEWQKKKDTKIPPFWWVKYPSLAGDLYFKTSLMGFKHTGLFPEQAVNWDFMQEKIMACKKKHPERKIKILNLFAYTGGATLACAMAGADEVVHLDASKKIIEQAKENAEKSSLQNAYIRYINDDVLKFLAREKRRGNFYDGIIMDPPAYGRGPSGELWQLEHQVYHLIQEAVSLLTPNALFLVLSAYATNLSPQSLKNIVGMTALGEKNGTIWADEIGLVQGANEEEKKKAALVLPCGFTVRYSGKDE